MVKSGPRLLLVWVFGGARHATPRYDKAAQHYSGVVGWRSERPGKYAAAAETRPPDLAPMPIR
jgi:hypothetical protein